LTQRREAAKPQGVARATCPFLPGNLPGSGFGRVARNHRRVACATLGVGFFIRIADGAEGDGGGFNGGGIPRPDSHHSILYLLSMLYDSIVASMFFSAGFDHF
jgi:hypothetical protein